MVQQRKAKVHNLESVNESVRQDRVRVILCSCPERHGSLDLDAASSLLQQAGLTVARYDHLCRHETFEKFMILMQSESESDSSPVIIGACTAALIGDLLKSSLGRMSIERPWELIDLKNTADPQTLLGECMARFSNQKKPGLKDCSLRPPSRRLERGRHLDDPVTALVVGGGVAGCQAALDLARSGVKTTLIEADPSLGGNMARLDKTFPTLDCSICILGPKLVEAANHPNITLMPQSRVGRVSGRPGRFHVEILREPRYVDMEKCSGCGTCMEVCPVIVPSAWNMGLKPAKAIGLVFEQAVPLRAAIQKDFCIDCGLCEQACERQAISLDQPARTVHLKAGALVLAHGARTLDAVRLGPYGYGRLPRVITNLEFERIVCSTGPTQGSLVTADNTVPERIAFIQCAGSRNRRYLPYCSGFCCTASIKQAMLALEHHPQTEVTIFFNDIRTTGKNFESLYLRARERGVRFIKSLPSRIVPDEEDRLRIHYDPPGEPGGAELEADLAVLALGLQAREDGIDWCFRGQPALDHDGFYQDEHPWCTPITSTCEGIFLAGSCHGPRDITQSVTEASGTAAEVIRFLNQVRTSRKN